MVRLSAQQELFAQAVFRGLGLGDAYRQAGYRASNRNSQDAIASRLLRNAKIVSRMEEMAQAKAISDNVTVQTVTNMLAAVYEDGRKYKQIGAAATAAMGIAKLHGLLVDKIEDVTRKPARHPDAPIEIEVEHWLSEHVGLLGAPALPEGEPSEAANAEHGNGLLETPGDQGPGDRFGAETIESPEGSRALSPEPTNYSGEGSQGSGGSEP